MTDVVAFSCYALHAAILLAFSSCLKLFLYGVPEIIRKLHYDTINQMQF